MAAGHRTESSGADGNSTPAPAAQEQELKLINLICLWRARPSRFAGRAGGCPGARPRLPQYLSQGESRTGAVSPGFVWFAQSCLPLALHGDHNVLLQQHAHPHFPSAIKKNPIKINLGAHFFLKSFPSLQGTVSSRGALKAEGQSSPVHVHLHSRHLHRDGFSSPRRLRSLWQVPGSQQYFGSVGFYEFCPLDGAIQR